MNELLVVIGIVAAAGLVYWAIHRVGLNTLKTELMGKLGEIHATAQATHAAALAPVTVTQIKPADFGPLSPPAVAPIAPPARDVDYTLPFFDFVSALQSKGPGMPTDLEKAKWLALHPGTDPWASSTGGGTQSVDRSGFTFEYKGNVRVNQLRAGTPYTFTAPFPCNDFKFFEAHGGQFIWTISINGAAPGSGTVLYVADEPVMPRGLPTNTFTVTVDKDGQYAAQVN